MPRAKPFSIPWARFSDSKLLDLRLRDLHLDVESSDIAPAVHQLYAELEMHHIRFKPHVWFSDEWFTPDNVPGIAIPFYLAHPRLRELEREQMLEVEGGTHDWCMRILRHEAGHAIDNAYRLHLKKVYQRLFGLWSTKYPESYRPKPYTKKFVLNLDMWYAQAHPAEDFAETFAVWLNPRSHWRQTYSNWPAMRKLKFVDQTMEEIAPLAPSIKTRRFAEPLRILKTTLREHYEHKKRYYIRNHPRFYDRDLRRLFVTGKQYAHRDSGAEFLESIRAEARHMISRWTGESQLTIDQTLADMIKRTRALRMRLSKSHAETKVDVMMMLAVQTMNYLNDGKHRVVL